MPVPPQHPLNAIRQPAFLYAPDGRIAAANDRAESLAGRPLAGRSPGDLIGIFGVRSPDGTPLLAADLPVARALQGEETIDVPLLITGADGRAMYVFVTASPIRGGGAILGAISVWQDVSTLEAALAEQSRLRLESETKGEELAVQEEIRQRGDELLRANAEIDRQRWFLDAIVRSVPSQISLWSADGRCIWANEATVALVGRARDDLIGRTWQEIGMDPEVMAPVMEEAGVVVATGAPFRNELIYPSADGPRWLEYGIVPCRNPGGTGTAALVVSHDISRRKQAEAALRERDLRLNLALDVAAVGTFDWNPATGAETWDDRIRAQWGLPPGAPVDHGVFEAGIHPDDRAAVAAANRRALDPAGDGRYAAEYRVIGLCDGVEHRITARGQVFFEGDRPVRMIGSTIDITEQRRAEEASREHERILQSLFRAAPAGIGLVSGVGPGRRLEQANDRFFEMTGYARDELIGQDTRLLYPDDEAYAAVGRESAAQLGARGRGEVETRWRRKDGTVFDLLINSSRIDPRDPDGGVIFTALDVTTLRESERSLKMYARDLQRSNEELQRFAYVASHDLQEPLRSIVSFSQLLERRYKGRLDADADDYIAFIVEGGVRMQALIRDLLQVSRVETRGRPAVPTDANGPAGDALRSLEPSIREAGATVTVDPLPGVVADPAQLEQVFVNLIGNAIKYRHPERPLEARVSAERRDDGMVEFSVADNGIGIEAEYFDRIFVIFQRLHTHDEYEGTGIGLAVVRKIVERHGGAVRVESTPGEGTTFFFTLPAA